MFCDFSVVSHDGKMFVKKIWWTPTGQNSTYFWRCLVEQQIKSVLTLSGPGGGGAQKPGWPNSQLPIRNLLFYDAQTWWLLVFILKIHSDQIWVKLINQGVAAAYLSSKRPQNFENEKIFLCLKIVEIDMGGQFWVEKNDSGHTNSFF